MYEEIKGIKPLGKFLSIKLMVFCVFWQQLFLTACIRFRAINATDTYSVTQVADSLQDFLICIEMFVLAISHLTIWPAKEFYMTEYHNPTPRSHMNRMGSVLYPGDMFKDLATAWRRAPSSRNVPTTTVNAQVNLTPLPEPSKGGGGSDVEAPNTTKPNDEKATEVIDQETPTDEPLISPVSTISEPPVTKVSKKPSSRIKKEISPIPVKIVNEDVTNEDLTNEDNNTHSLQTKTISSRNNNRCCW